MGLCGSKKTVAPTISPAKPNADSQVSSQIDSRPDSQKAVVQVANPNNPPPPTKTKPISGPSTAPPLAPPPVRAKLPPQPVFQAARPAVDTIPPQPLAESPTQPRVYAFPPAIAAFPPQPRVEVSPQAAVPYSVPKVNAGLVEPQKIAQSASVAPAAGQVFQLQVKDIKGRTDFTIPINSLFTGQELFDALREKMSDKREFQVVHFGKPIKCDAEEVGKSGLSKDTLVYCIFKPNS